MRTRWERLGTLAVAVTVVTGGVSMLGVHSAAAAAPIGMRGSAFGAPALYRMQETPPDATGSEVADGPEAAEGAEGAENETAEAPGDETMDGIDCVQQGEHEGENEGC